MGGKERSPEEKGPDRKRLRGRGGSFFFNWEDAYLLDCVGRSIFKYVELGDVMEALLVW